MTVTFKIHLEPADSGWVWWSETDAVPRLSIAAPTLAELRGLIDEAVAKHLDASDDIFLDLVVDEEPVEAAPFTPSNVLPFPIASGAVVRRALVVVR